MVAKPPFSVLFVCLGNICRSPLAEGVFRSALAECGRADRFVVDSAGTGAWHAGSAPDPRSIAVAARHGIDISGQKARKITAADFTRFDLILALDRSNLADLTALAPAGATARSHLFLDYALGRRRDVPDPYYGGADGFLEVYRMIREASDALAEALLRDSPPLRAHASSTI